MRKSVSTGALVSAIALCSMGQAQVQMQSNAVPQQANAMPQQALNSIGHKQTAGSVTPIPLAGLKAERMTTAEGKPGWRVRLPGNHPLATPAVVDGMVFIGGGFGSYEFYAFDARTGEARWAIKVSDDGPTAAVVAEGVVAFNTESCTLFVVDAKSGRMLWSKWLGDPLMSQPAIADGKVFMAFPDNRGQHQLVALGLKDGVEQWRAPIAGDIISAPIVDGRGLYLATLDGTVYRYNLSNGALVWQKPFLATSAPWIYKEQIFVSKREPGQAARPVEGVARMEVAGGKQNQEGGSWRKRAAQWLDADVQGRSRYAGAQKSNDSAVGFSTAPSTAKLGQAAGNIGQSTVQGAWEYQGSRPCVANGRLFLTQGDQVVAMDPDSGKEIWSKDLSGVLKEVGGHLGAPPSPAGDKLYVATVDGTVLVLAQQNGKVVDTIAVKSAMRFQPAVQDGRLVAGTVDGQLISVQLDDAAATGWAMWGGSPAHNGG